MNIKISIAFLISGIVASILVSYFLHNVIFAFIPAFFFFPFKRKREYAVFFLIGFLSFLLPYFRYNESYLFSLVKILSGISGIPEMLVISLYPLLGGLFLMFASIIISSLYSIVTKN
ncbi:hypothetical protein [Caldiplasma sukawensis]